MNKNAFLIILMLFFLFFLAFSESTETFFISEFSSDFYPKVYFTLESAERIKRASFMLYDNDRVVTDFTFKEEVEKKTKPIEVVLVTQYDEANAYGDYLIEDGLLEIIKRLVSIHDDVKVKICLFDGMTYRKNLVNFENDYETIRESHINYNMPTKTSTETATETTVFNVEGLRRIPEIEFGIESTDRFIIYYSGEDKANDVATLNNFFKAEDLIYFHLSSETLSENSNIRNDLFSSIFTHAYDIRHRYLVGYYCPLNPLSKKSHGLAIRNSGQLIVEHNYTVELAQKSRFIFDLNTVDYPVVSFSYFDELKEGSGKNNLYENLERNDSFSISSKKSKFVDFVFVIEDTYYSKFYYQYLIQKFKVFLKEFNNKGYSVRVGFITFGENSEVVLDLNLNFENLMSKFERFNFSGGHYTFEKALKAIVKATELSYIPGASKNIIFVQSSDMFFNETKSNFDMEQFEKIFLSRQINFFGITNNEFFYDFAYRVPGKVASLDFDMVELLKYIENAESYEYFAKNSGVGVVSEIMLIDDENRICKTRYTINPRDLKKDFRINSITASPFIARKGEAVTLKCDTWPIKGVEFEWFEVVAGSGNFKDGSNSAEVTWIAPIEVGYHTIKVEVKYFNYKLCGQVVVLVQ